MSRKKREKNQKNKMRFENRKGTHNKWYEINVQPGPDDTFRVFTSWGRIGSEQVKNKVIYEGEIEGCMKAFQKKRKDRVKHGYDEVD